MTYLKPLPDVSAPGTKPFWSGLRDHCLRVQRCSDCQALRYPAATICPECLSRTATWIDVPASGTLWSYVVYHRDMAGTFGDDVPYAVGVVELDCDGRMHILARIDAPLDEIEIGAAMEARYVQVTEDVTLLRWCPLISLEAKDV
jgi:uncharacterized protein